MPQPGDAAVCAPSTKNAIKTKILAKELRERSRGDSSVCKGKFRSFVWRLSHRRYMGFESEQDLLPCVRLLPASMTSHEITRGKGRAWCLVRSRVIVTSRFWELSPKPFFFYLGTECVSYKKK